MHIFLMSSKTDLLICSISLKTDRIDHVIKHKNWSNIKQDHLSGYNKIRIHTYQAPDKAFWNRGIWGISRNVSPFQALFSSIA